MALQVNKERHRIVAALINAQRVLLVPHIFPDGDALGSQLALGNILESMGKDVYYYSEHKASHLYDFLPGCERLDTDLPDPASFDAAVAVDCGDFGRLGKNGDQLLKIKPFMVIDHHVGHKKFGDISWVDAGRSSTGEMIYDLAEELGAEVSYQAAYCLFTAIVSDTGSFKYDSTTGTTFRVAGHLLDKGVNPAEVAGRLFDNFTISRLSLLEEVLSTLNLYSDERIAVISVTRGMFEKCGAVQGDTEDFINYPRALISVKVAAFIKESVDEDMVSVSLRAKGECDVAAIAAGFGGGGHRNAAGFRLAGASVDEVRGRLVPSIEAALG